MRNALEGFVKIKSKRVCHKNVYDKIGEVFGYGIRSTGTVVYGVSLNGKDYEFYEYELEPVIIARCDNCKHSIWNEKKFEWECKYANIPRREECMATFELA